MNLTNAFTHILAPQADKLVLPATLSPAALSQLSHLHLDAWSLGGVRTPVIGGPVAGAAGSGGSGAPPASSAGGTSAAQPSGKPVLQLNALPQTLTPSLYANARSTSNPNGDLMASFQFRQLVNSLPTFSHVYMPSGSYFEEQYRGIVQGSNATASPSYAGNLIAAAIQQLSGISFANMDGTPGTWCPVDAMPSDWWDTSKANRFQPLSIDLTKQGGPNSAFDTIGSTDSSLQLSLGGTSRSVDAATQLHSVSLKYLLVQVIRPWFLNALFSAAGWAVGGQGVGFCSSGRLDQNNGVFPLVPTAMLLGTEVSVNATWAARDQALLDAAHVQNRRISFGPFQLNNTSALQVIGWVSNLVPLAPH